MSDLIHRLRVKVDVLRDRVFELEADRAKETELANWRISELENAVDDLRGVNSNLRKQLEDAGRHDWPQPVAGVPTVRNDMGLWRCSGCGAPADMHTPKCSKCYKRHWMRQQRRLRRLRLVPSDGAA